MSSIEKQRQRVEQEMTKMVDGLDKAFLRKMQVNWIYLIGGYARLKKYDNIHNVNKYIY